jgi:NAD(P)-dependent dehydrogenase (short-subunit alcohol dehydrogenase family)
MTQGRNALVTGCSTGIGRAVALDLLGQGWRVFATLRKQADADSLLEAARDARIANQDLHTLLLDVTDAESVQEAAKTMAEQLDGEALHGVVHNAGVANIGPLEVMPLDFFRHQLDVNLTGVLCVTQAVLPLMRQGEAPAGSRRIVMISSINGQVGTPLGGAYCASKFGLEGMSDVLRCELLPQGIDVVVIEPGAIATAIWETSKQRAEALLPDFDGHPAMPHYRGFLDAIMQKVMRIQSQAIDAVNVAVVVRRALNSKRPAVRSRVGKDAKLGYFLKRWLPTRWFDKLIVQDMLKR